VKGLKIDENDDAESEGLKSMSSGNHSEDDDINKIEKLKLKALDDQEISDINQ
jgi:hypothetical protein